MKTSELQSMHSLYDETDDPEKRRRIKNTIAYQSEEFRVACQEFIDVGILPWLVPIVECLSRLLKKAGL